MNATDREKRLLSNTILDTMIHAVEVEARLEELTENTDWVANICDLILREDSAARGIQIERFDLDDGSPPFVIEYHDDTTITVPRSFFREFLSVLRRKEIP